MSCGVLAAIKTSHTANVVRFMSVLLFVFSYSCLKQCIGSARVALLAGPAQAAAVIATIPKAAANSVIGSVAVTEKRRPRKNCEVAMDNATPAIVPAKARV